MSDIPAILAEREKTHGRFADVAYVYSEMIQAMACKAAQKDVWQFHQYAADMIVMKLARIACGDADHADHWRDIAGYAQLVVRQLEPPEEATHAKNASVQDLRP